MVVPPRGSRTRRALRWLTAKVPKPTSVSPVAVHQRGLHRAHKSIERAGRLHSGYLRVAGNRFDQIPFVHAASFSVRSHFYQSRR
jgi:hypothetical protein